MELDEIAVQDAELTNGPLALLMDERPPIWTTHLCSRDEEVHESQKSETTGDMTMDGEPA